MSAFGCKADMPFCAANVCLRDYNTLAPRPAWVIHAAGNLLRAFGCQFIQPIDQLGIPATFLKEAVEPVTAIGPAFLTSHAQRIEFADEVAEDDGTVAGMTALTILGEW
jgi:hypothetical protein